MAGLSASALFHLFSTGDRSDFTITSQEHDFNVHKIVICTSSHFFEAISKGNSKDSVEVKDTTPATLARVLHFLYLEDYHEDESACSSQLHGPNLTSGTDLFIDTPLLCSVATTPSEHDDSLARGYASTNIDVDQCADMWGIELLKRLATVKIMANMRIMSTQMVTSTVASAYNITTSDDNVLRPAIIDTCIMNHVEITSGCPNLVDLLEQHESRTWRAALTVGDTSDEVLEIP